MKKFTTLALSLAVSATAMAQAVQNFAFVEAKDFSTVQAVERSSQTIFEDNKVAPKAETLETKAVPDDATIYPYAKYPSGTFFPYNTYVKDGGKYMYPIALLPPYAELEWLNYTFYVTSSKMALATKEYTWNWTYTDFNGDEASATDQDLKTINQPKTLKNYPESPIVMASTDGSLVYETNSLVFGGDGTFQPWIVEALGATDPQCETYPFNIFADDLASLGRTGSFGSGANIDGSGWEYYAETFAEEGATNFRVEAMAQVFEKPAAPYALKKISIKALVEAQAGAQLNFTFFKTDDDGNMTDEVIYKYTYTFAEAASAGSYIDIPVEFTTVDELGFELDYKIIDSGMVMMITGYEDEKFEEFDLPVAFFLRRQPTTAVNGTQLYAFCSYVYNGETLAGLLDFPYSFYTSDRTDYMIPTSMYMTVDVEYPYLMTYGDYVTSELIDPAAEHDVYVNAGETAAYGLLCYGKAEDILYTAADGGDIPEWLEVEVVDNATANGEDVIVAFTVVADADDTEKSCDVVLSYKGQTQTFHVAQATSGIENIAVDSNVAPKYYNLQGMEVANPENGFYIVKRGNKVAKEMFVK